MFCWWLVACPLAELAAAAWEKEVSWKICDSPGVSLQSQSFLYLGESSGWMYLIWTTGCDASDWIQGWLSRVLGTVRVTPSTFPQTVGVSLLVHPWGSTFSVDDTQFRSCTGASFQLWWLGSCQRAVRLGDELFFSKIRGWLQPGALSWALWRGSSCCEHGSEFGVTDLVLRCPSDLWWVRSLGAWVNWGFTPLDKLKVNAVTPAEYRRVPAREGMRDVSCNTMDLQGL